MLLNKENNIQDPRSLEVINVLEQIWREESAKLTQSEGASKHFDSNTQGARSLGQIWGRKSLKSTQSKDDSHRLGGDVEVSGGVKPINLVLEKFRLI